jgi:hypothetical protein
LPADWLVCSHEHLFEFMAATYHVATGTQAPNPNWWMTILW